MNDGRVREEHMKPSWGHSCLKTTRGGTKYTRRTVGHDRCLVTGRMKHQVKADLEEMRRRVDDFLKTAEWKKAEAQGWGVNRCDSAQVFTADQMYIASSRSRLPPI